MLWKIFLAIYLLFSVLSAFGQVTPPADFRVPIVIAWFFLCFTSTVLALRSSPKYVALLYTAAWVILFLGDMFGANFFVGEMDYVKRWGVLSYYLYVFIAILAYILWVARLSKAIAQSGKGADTSVIGD